LVELLASDPKLRVLITSRAVLHLSGEHEFVVPPLALPARRQLPILEQLTQYAAVRLFIERAQAVKADFAVTITNASAVAEICYRLDGLPLAIELAAARVKLFPPQALLTRLGSRLKLLTGGARDLPARQQTIRNTIDWSYELLDADQQALFARLGVFVGGCTLEAAEAVCNADGDLRVDIVDGIAALLDQSLVRQEAGMDGEPRFVMLETIREYALEQLERSGKAKTLQQHAAYFLQLTNEIEPKLHTGEQRAGLERLAAEFDNLRVALRWAIADGSVDTAVRSIMAMSLFWHLRDHLSEGRQWLETALVWRGLLPKDVCAKAVYTAGQLSYGLKDRSQAQQYYTESLVLFRDLGDKHGIANVLASLGVVVDRTWSDHTQAMAMLEESLALFRDLGDKRGIAAALDGLGRIANGQGNYTVARAHLEESLAFYRALGDKWGIAGSLQALGEVARNLGEYATARVLWEQRLAVAQELGHQDGIASSFHVLGRLAHLQCDYERAMVLIEQSLALWRELGIKPQIAWAIYNLARVLQDQNKYQQAVVLFTESIALAQEIGDNKLITMCLVGFAAVAFGVGQGELAVRLLGAASAGRDILDSTLLADDCTEYDRRVAAIRGHIDGATFAAAWAAGRALTLEQAIAYALEPPA
jgi:predicted ATPase